MSSEEDWCLLMPRALLSFARKSSRLPTMLYFVQVSEDVMMEEGWSETQETDRSVRAGGKHGLEQRAVNGQGHVFPWFLERYDLSGTSPDDVHCLFGTRSAIDWSAGRPRGLKCLPSDARKALSRIPPPQPPQGISLQ